VQHRHRTWWSEGKGGGALTMINVTWKKLKYIKYPLLSSVGHNRNNVRRVCPRNRVCACDCPSRMVRHYTTYIDRYYYDIIISRTLVHYRGYYTLQPAAASAAVLAEKNETSDSACNANGQEIMTNNYVTSIPRSRALFEHGEEDNNNKRGRPRRSSNGKTRAGFVRYHNIVVELQKLSEPSSDDWEIPRHTCLVVFRHCFYHCIPCR